MIGKNDVLVRLITVLLNLNSRHEKRHRRISRGWIFILLIQCQIFDLYAGIYGSYFSSYSCRWLHFFRGFVRFVPLYDMPNAFGYVVGHGRPKKILEMEEKVLRSQLHCPGIRNVLLSSA